MKCNHCGQEFGEDLNCRHCGVDRVEGLGSFSGFQITNDQSHNGSSLESYDTMRRICSNCGEIIPQDSNYCPYCGKSLFVTCPACGYRHPSSYVFCNHCGTNRVLFLANHKQWICTVCGYVHEGANEPASCPLCKAPGHKFNKM